MALPSQRRLSCRSFLMVEPVLFFWAFGLFMSVPILQQYVYFRISEDNGFPYSAERETGCQAGNDSDMAALERKVQDSAARYDIGNVMIMSIPSVIVSLMLGPWTDTAGRKRAIVAPAIGSLLESINTLLVMYLKWPILVLFVGSAFTGFSGFFTVMTQASMAYIADTTPEQQVALRLAIMQLMLLIGGLVSQLTTGPWLRTYGFIEPYWFIFACFTLATFYVVVLLPESTPKTKREPCRLLSCDSFKVIWSVYADPRNGYRRSLFLLLIGDGLVSLATMGLSGVISLFVLRSPLCWSPTYFGGFMAFRFLTQGIGGIVVFAFASKTWVVFLVPIVGLLTGTISPIMKGMITQLTRPDERGAAFSAVAAISTFCNFLGAFVFNPIYIRSQSIGFPGLVFLVCAAVTVFPLAIFSFLKNTKYLPRDWDEETTGVEEASEKSPDPETNEYDTQLQENREIDWVDSHDLQDGEKNCQEKDEGIVTVL
ncbi:proton-coupled folate transporter-like isoform X2 [Nematostella vectensis]|uniref:proton-coupled folate transporter-like isoform X2 n=1 Tax=Nematostella vectensis TaxID=45351 RepID=UPI002076FE5D|nr:proton-coupled folate transporter-like isoform X2 [Nematostella vectensis]